MDDFNTSLSKLKKDILFMEKNHKENLYMIKKNPHLDKEEINVHMSFKPNFKSPIQPYEENEIKSLKSSTRSNFENHKIEQQKGNGNLNQTMKLPNSFNIQKNENYNIKYKSNLTTNYLPENFNLNLKENKNYKTEIDELDSINYTKSQRNSNSHLNNFELNKSKKVKSDLANSISPLKKKDQNQNPITQELRMSNLEKRMENMEKILHFYDEMMKLKDEEKVNEARIDKNKLNEISKKINLLEENHKFVNSKFKEISDNFDNKMENFEKKLMKILDSKNSLSEFYAKKLSDFEDIYKQTEIFFEAKMDEKLISLQKSYDNKLEDMLNLMNEFTLQLDKNEFNLLSNKENIKNVQNDHLDFLKIVSILKEKTNALDFVMDQITDLKFKYAKVLEIYGNQNQNENIKNNENNETIGKSYRNFNSNSNIDNNN